MRIALGAPAIDLDALTKAIAGGEHGAIATFLGVVRNTNDGRLVTGIDYSAYDAMAEREMELIANEASEMFGTTAIAIQHRTGYLEVGEASVGIVVAHANRKPALAAVGHIIEELKARVPIWKCEHYADGRREWVSAGSASGIAR